MGKKPKKKTTKLFMAVTPDEYELPLFVTESLDEMAKKFNKTKSMISSSICHERQGGRCGIKFIRVEVENDDGEIK